jgi:hypothetical protein
VRDVPEDFHTQVGPRLEPLLAPGETLEGLCAPTQQSAFRGCMVALAVTDRRLVVQQAGLAALATWVRRHHPKR